MRAILKAGVLFFAVLLSNISVSNSCFASGKWNQKNSLVTTVGDHSAVVYNGKMYIFGGSDDDYFYNDLWEYDFESDSWVLKTEGATSRDTQKRLSGRRSSTTSPRPAAWSVLGTTGRSSNSLPQGTSRTRPASRPTESG